MFPFNFGGTKHFLEKSVGHPEFSMQKLDFDVAVIKVQVPFKFSKSIQAVPLPPVDSEESFLDFNQNVTISGWGVTGVSRRKSSSFKAITAE